MERMMHEVVHGLAEYADVSVIGPQGCSQYLPKSVNVREAPSSLLGFLLISSLKAIRICREQKFSIIIGGSGLVGPNLVLLKKVFRVRTAVFLHGLDVIAPSRIYQGIFIPSIRRTDRIFANSRNTCRLAAERDIPQNKMTVINPGCHPPDPAAHSRVEAFRTKHRLGDKLCLLFVGRMTERKGLSLFITNALPGILEEHPEALLLIVGDDASDALNSTGEKAKVLHNLDLLTPEQRSRVQFLGQVCDDELNTSYATASVHIFPVLDIPGDVEGFGMVAIEAASYGTPTVAFDVGGVSDAVGKQNGQLVAAGDYNAFKRAITDTLRDPDKQHYNCNENSSHSTWAQFNRELRNQVESTRGRKAGR
ncbi:glycosyltransferase family 4 protein [Parahaliea mediterranea]|uniref:Glycosyltransferase family 4 protein n=1 Tax=Parahaliea mediterranea TaxID=651086 RepID=A0A939IKI3_9GAMM|nr:glycosyltransferase family 4 protein [Parahaliea mediterranea]MBN7795480.1 glycosyltransferase family 4 protein [Parahaliea mediterranea]